MPAWYVYTRKSQILPAVMYEVIFARIEQDDRMTEPEEISDP